MRWLRLLSVLILITVFSHSLFSIPLFARKYQRSCFTCHTSPPMLNEFGRRFQSNGYQLPGTIESTPIWRSNQLPFAVMLHAMYMYMGMDMNEKRMKTESTFEPGGADVLSGGVLGKHLSYFAAMVIGEGGASVEVAHVILNNLIKNSNLNLRMGIFRLDLPFPVNLALTGGEDIPYLVYEYASEADEGEFSLAEPQVGISAYGFLPQVLDGLRYEVALVNGTNVEADVNNRPDIYLRLNQSVWINNAPFRAGILYYLGKQGVDSVNNFNRFGFDFELYDPWTKKVNLFFQYMTAQDKLPGETIKMNGGFVGANLFLIPEKLYAQVRYDFLKAGEKNETQIDIGLKYHFMPNLYLTIDYMRKMEKEGGMKMTMNMLMTMFHILF